MKCPGCRNGTKIGPNGESWRCNRCGGTGNVPDPEEVERLREDLAHTRRMLTILREGDGHMIREATEMLREELDEMPPEIAGIRSAWLDKLMMERDMLRANIDRLERELSGNVPLEPHNTGYQLWTDADSTVDARLWDTTGEEMI